RPPPRSTPSPYTTLFRSALLLDEFGLVQQLGADGAHLSHGKDLESRYREARQAVGSTGIVGFDAGNSRHDAMTIAEAGADYVALDRKSTRLNSSHVKISY